MNNKIVRISALFALMTCCAFAQKKDTIVSKIQLDEVVISDSKFALPREKSGKVITKITASDLAKKEGQTLATVLNSVVGVEINGNQGAAGRNQSYYIRGARNQQTIILIDGIPASDASGISLEYDLRLIPVEEVESIEIMKGAASTLYGSGASAGVINITLKKAKTNQYSGNVYFNTGTQVTVNQTNYKPQEFNQGFSFGTKKEKINFYTSVNSTETNGISDAKGVNFESDAFSRFNSLVKLGFTPNKKWNLDFHYQYDKLKSDFDSGTYADNPDNVSNSEQFKIGFSPSYKFNKGEVVVNTSAAQIDRDIFQFGSISYFKSRNIISDAFLKYQITDNLFTVGGTQFQFYEMSNKNDYSVISENQAKFNMFDPYLNLVYNSNFGLNINTGGRLNIHSDYGSHWVYNFNPSFQFKEIPLKLLASYSTAFVSPSLYQLFSSYGDINLTPEENKTAEAGFEMGLLQKKIKLNAVAFLREDQNSIGFDLVNYKYFNQSQLKKTTGIETMVGYQILSNLNFNANYTFNELNGTARILNPKHKFNAVIDWETTSKFGISLMYQAVSQRYYEYTSYPSPTYNPVLNSLFLKSYELFDANIRYKLCNKKLNLFASVTNILNKDYEELFGYNTKRRNFKLGLNINL